MTAKSVGRGRLCCWVTGLPPRGEAGNGSQVFTVSMLSVLWLISLTVALVADSARAAGLEASYYMLS